jgi:hypothetical protein
LRGLDDPFKERFDQHVYALLLLRHDPVDRRVRKPGDLIDRLQILLRYVLHHEAPQLYGMPVFAAISGNQESCALVGIQPSAKTKSYRLTARFAEGQYFRKAL